MCTLPHVKQLMGASIAVALILAGCGSGGTKTVTVTSTSSSASASSSTSSGGPTSETATTPPSTSTSASMSTSTASTVTATVHLATFKSPTGNIGCMIIAGTARCDIRKRTWSPPPRPASCPNEVDFGQGLIVTRSGPARFVCAGDTSADPSAQSLGYGTATSVGGFTCVSASSGMSCRNTATGHGFVIAIQGYRIF